MPTTRMVFASLRIAFASCFLLLAGHATAAGPSKAAIASAHPLASAAGMEVLAAGGNAFDAAVAVAAALAVVEPYGSGLGGGGFFLLHDERTGRQVVIDAREMAPERAAPDMYQNKKGEAVSDWSTNGPAAAAIPGTPAALAHVAGLYGVLPLGDSLKPAIRLARDGFPADERYRQMARTRLEVLRRYAETSRTLLAKGGEVPATGTMIRQPELAATLELLAAKGREGFYQGEFAQRMVDGIAEAGGIWTMADLAGYVIKERDPLVANYRGARVVTVPPPSAGGVALLSMLAVLDAAGYGEATGTVRDHLVVETMRRAFRDRALHLGDADFVPVPVSELLSFEHTKKLAGSIDRIRATPSAALGDKVAPSPQGEQTTHLSIIDRNGNRVAATLSINLAFGSGFMVPGTGVLLNNEMDDFAAAPGVPNAYGLPGSVANAIAPGKRPLSSMTPTFLEYGDRVAIVGTPGGSRIPGMVLATLLALMDSKDPAAAIAAPRFHHQYLPDVVEVEPEYFGSTAARELRARGHVLRSTGRNYGNMQLVLWEKSADRVITVSDPRGIGLGMSR
ncbi:MAG: gamma-glutamyltransferase [Gammaproteobacteria bacterium]